MLGKRYWCMLIIILVGLISLSASSAAQDNSTDIISMDETTDYVVIVENSDNESGSDLTSNPNDDSVFDYHSFKELNESISKSAGELNLTHDYKYDNNGECFIDINKDVEFTLNGNGHVIEGIDTGDVLFFRSSQKIIINNLTFRNCINTTFNCYSLIVFNDVNFINCSGVDDAVFLNFFNGGNTTFNRCVFEMKNGSYYIINCEQVALILNNSIFKGGDFSRSTIEINRGGLMVENTTFVNMTARLGAAINYKGWNFTVRKSKFINLSALTAGAIIGKYFPRSDGFPGSPFVIEDCEFINLTAINDAAAIYFDFDSGSEHLKQTLNMFNTNFTNCKSIFGGAIAVQGGILNIEESNFVNNFASFEGGALFTTWSNVNLVRSNLINNTAGKNAGAIYFDKGNLTVRQSYFVGNKVTDGFDGAANAIYAHDVGLCIVNSTFDNGGISVYGDFASDSKIENVTRNNDVFSLNNTDYIVSVESNGIKLNITKNEIIVDKLPSRFDLRDWGWVSPNKTQGDNDDCWAFATAGAIESALLRTTGVLYNLSENHVQKLEMKYALNGDLRISLTGFAYSGLGYALSWYGVLPTQTPYDDRGMAIDTDFDDPRIHLQDAMFIFGGRDDTIELIKKAVLKYGPVSVQIVIGSDEPPKLNTTGDDIAVMNHGIHFVSIIGWDDNYGDNESDDPKGVFFCKESVRGFYDVISYYYPSLLESDEYALVPQNAGICYIFENDMDYHVNYQTDLTGLTGFDGNYTYYSNEFTSKYGELIGAVGTYFNDSGIDYSFDVYVNGNKVLTQSGISEFAGFRTIILNKYIPVNAGDKFKVVFKNNAIPYQAYSREHYIANMSFISKDGKSWEDITLENRTVCLKAYTVKDDSKIIDNKDISVDYAGGKYFSVKVVSADGHELGAGASVKFIINGKATMVKTNGEGIAKIKITQTPGKYTIKTTYNGATKSNKVTVKQVLTSSKVTVKKTSKKFTLNAKLKINGKLQKGKTIKFKLNGKTYRVKTNARGIAQKTFKKNVLKKLKKGKTYAVKVTYLKDTIKTTVKVR